MIRLERITKIETAGAFALSELSGAKLLRSDRIVDDRNRLPGGCIEAAVLTLADNAGMLVA